MECYLTQRHRGHVRTSESGHLRSRCCWSAGMFSSSTNMESAERLVLHDQRGDGDGFGNRILGNLGRPFAYDLIPCHCPIKLIQDDPDHDARTLERGLAAADSRICNNVPSQFDPAVLSISLRFHAAARIVRPRNSFASCVCAYFLIPFTALKVVGRIGE